MYETPDPPTPPARIRLALSRQEWNEFQAYVHRRYEGMEDFFTRKVLELIAQGRKESGRPVN
jgi:hypothetical protein